jgi:hypothetical protein
MAVQVLNAVFGKRKDADVIASIEAEPSYQRATFLERLTGAYLPKRYADAVARNAARRS